MLIIGLDAATQPERFGYAVAEKSPQRVRILNAGVLKSHSSADALSVVIAPRLKRATRALVAIDAPLGWPASAGPALVGHSAGEQVKLHPDRLFHRITDEFVQSKIKKRPLEVGASLIARAAYAALSALQRLREETRLPLPLVWAPSFDGIGVIEVYPGASLKVWGIEHDGYKKDPHIRHRISKQLSGRASGIVELAIDPVDAFDAALCVIAGADFLDGRVWLPEDAMSTRKEGWIWFRKNDE